MGAANVAPCPPTPDNLAGSLAMRYGRTVRGTHPEHSRQLHRQHWIPLRR